MFTIVREFLCNPSSKLTKSGRLQCVDAYMSVCSPLGFLGLVLKNKISFGNRPAPGSCALCCQLRLRLGARFGILGKSFVSISQRKKGRKSREDIVGHTLLGRGAEADNRLTFPLAQSRDSHSFFSSGVELYNRAELGEERSKEQNWYKTEHYLKNALFQV